MIIPKTFFEVQMGLPYYLTWIVFGRIASVDLSATTSLVVGIALHLVTSISIGIATGIFLYKTRILNISKRSNGLIYGVITGITIFVVFFIPVNQFILAPEITQTLLEIDPSLSPAKAAEMIEHNQIAVITRSIVMHLVFGITLGLVSSLLEKKLGARYRCSQCNISFSRIDSLRKHIESIHGSTPVKLVP